MRCRVEADNPQIEYSNGVFRGYTLSDLNRQEWISTYCAVGDIGESGSTGPLALAPFPGSPVETDALLWIASGFRRDNGRVETPWARPMPSFLPFLP